MKNRVGRGRLALVIASLSVVPAGTVTAHADPAVEVTTADGTVVGVGDVIAVGSRSGSTCTFPDGAGVVMTLTSGSGSTTLHIDDTCRVSVQAIESSPDVNAVNATAWSIEPKHPDGAPSGTPVALPQNRASVLDPVMVILSGKKPTPPPPPEPVSLWTGRVVQTFLFAGQPQWRDEIELEYAQGVNSGTIVTSSIGERTDCAVVTIDPTTTYTNVKSNCTYHITAASGPYAELSGSGDYQQLLLTQELASATSKEVFIVTKTDYSGSCPLPGSMTIGWDIHCAPTRE